MYTLPNMATLSSPIRARLTATLAVKEQQLTLVQAAYTKALESGDTESYKFDSREGKQETVLRSPSVLSKEIRILEAEINRLYNRLDGTGLVNMNLRRRY